MSVLYPDLNNTTFPNEIDNISQMLALTTTDAPLIKQFQTYMKDGNFSAAQNVIVQIENYKQKIISASYINQLRDSILAVERFYKEDVEPYIDEKQAYWDSVVNRMSYIGNYSPSNSYFKNNYVTFNDEQGKTFVYICTNDAPAGIAPTNSNYWRVLTIKGSKGDSGVGGAFMYEWDSSVNYSVNDIVTYGNKWWICTTSNSNQMPISGSTYWSVVLSLESETYPCQQNEPIGQSENQLWFQIVGES